MRMTLTHPDKLLFPAAGLCKHDIVDYYRRIAPLALPHCRGRALTLRRYPDGIEREGFFQKHAPHDLPSCIRRARLPMQGGTITQILADDAATLAWLANAGTIELHVALARATAPRRPDRIVFDLDPPDEPDDDFAAIQTAARAVRKLGDELGLFSAVQTSGSRGLHVVWPVTAEEDYDRVHAFARDCATLLAQRHPDTLTAAQRKAARQRRVFVDYLRNAYGQTAVAPYSLRALPGAPLATPLDWREALAYDMHAQRYHLRNVFRRLGQRDCPWRDLDLHAGALAPAIERLRQLRDA